jgi:hypothetical protein
MVDFIYRHGSQDQKLALEAVLDLAAQIDGEWGICQSAEWFRANPSQLDEPFLAILRAVTE